MVPTVQEVLLVGTVRNRHPCTVLFRCFRTLRRRHQHGRSGENVVEVVVMLRADDLAQLQEDEVWNTWVV
jgi:hypothetical protein